MRLLLDSNALIWRMVGDPRMRQSTIALLNDPHIEVATSAAAVWEIEIKRIKGKLNTPAALLEALDEAGIAILPIDAHDAVLAASLPRHHDDPFDRMLVAQAIRHGWTLVTSDADIARYQVAIMAP